MASPTAAATTAGDSPDNNIDLDRSQKYITLLIEVGIRLKASPRKVILAACLFKYLYLFVNANEIPPTYALIACLLNASKIDDDVFSVTEIVTRLQQTLNVRDEINAERLAWMIDAVEIRLVSMTGFRYLDLESQLLQPFRTARKLIDLNEKQHAEAFVNCYLALYLLTASNFYNHSTGHLAGSALYYVLKGRPQMERIGRQWQANFYPTLPSVLAKPKFDGILDTLKTVPDNVLQHFACSMKQLISDRDLASLFEVNV